MASSKPEPNWQGLINTWSESDAEDILASPCALTNGSRLEQLLKTTQELLSPPLRQETIKLKQATAAVKSKAVALLARLAHMLHGALP